MGSVSWPVLGATFFCDVTAFALELGAMAQRSEASTIYTESGSIVCVFTKDTSIGLAATSMAFLFVAQALISFHTKCFCFGKPDERENCGKLCVIVLLTTSWTMFVIAELILMAGAIVNNIQLKELIDIGGITLTNDVFCMQVKKVTFSVGATFTFLTMLLNIIYYVLKLAVERKEKRWDLYLAEGNNPVVPRARATRARTT